MSARLQAAFAELADALLEEVRAELAARQDGPPELLSVDAAARRAGLGRSLLYQLIAAGKVRSVKVGRRRLIPADALRQLAAESEAE